MGRFQLVLIALLFSLSNLFAPSNLLGASNFTQTFTPSKKECFSEQLPVPYSYCVHTPTYTQANGDIAYLLHGRGLNEHTWNQEKYYTGMIQKYWEENKVSPPIVVTVSFGPIWLLAPRGEANESGLAPTFAYGVIPTIETRIGEPKRHRILMGESMGGLNSLMLSLLYPDMFKKVASLCPVIYDASPYDDQSKIDQLIRRTGADENLVMGTIALAKQFFANDEEWQAASPLATVQTVNIATAPEYYLSCGIDDAFGNFEGNEKFIALAKARGIKVDWRPMYGGHCVTDPKSVADFLVR